MKASPGRSWHDERMVWVADDLAAWLVEQLADAGRRKLVDLILGDEFERSLRHAATDAVRALGAELSPDDPSRAEHLGQVISEVFRIPLPGAAWMGTTIVEGLQAGIAAQVTVLEDRTLTTEEGMSSASAEGIADGAIAPRLARQLISRIVSQGVRGGPLASLATQLSSEVIWLQGRDTQNTLSEMRAWLGQLHAEIAAVSRTARAVEGFSGKARGAAIVRTIAQATPDLASRLVGRDAAVDRLLKFLTPGKGSQSAVVVSALVEGMGGVGKTALALRTASIAAGRGWFPGGVLFADLRGYDQDTEIGAQQVLEPLLLCLRVDAPQVPHAPASQAALYYQVLARLSEEDKPVLLVLDNVSSASQIETLIPASLSHRVLITSRNALSNLGGAAEFRLGALNLDDSVRVLAEVLISKNPGDRRLHRELELTKELAVSCAGLPLALEIAASILARYPAMTVRNLVDELSETTNRLQVLADGKRAVWQVVDSSWRLLHSEDPLAAELIVMLGLYPGADISTDAAAELAGLSLIDVRRQLRALDRANLIQMTVDGLWRMHDLVRDYVVDRARMDVPDLKRREALERLARFYYGCVNYAFDLQNPDNPMVDAEFLRVWKKQAPDACRSVKQADRPATWFERERAGLLALVRIGAAEEPPLPITPRLACSMFYFLERGGHFGDWALVEEIAERIAFVGSNRRDQARSLRNRGRLSLVEVLEDYEQVRDASEPSTGVEAARQRAIELLERSRSYYMEEYAARHQFADRAGEATTIRELADAYRLGINSARPDPTGIATAEEAYRSAESIYASLGSDNGLASLWLALGITLTLAGRYEEAMTCLQDSLEYSSSSGPGSSPRHARLMGFALRRIGDLYVKQNLLDAAVTSYERSVQVFTADGDTTSAARALARLGEVEITRQNTAGARHAFQIAQKYFAGRPLGERDPEALVVASRLEDLGSSHVRGT